jgi:acetyl esterase
MIDPAVFRQDAISAETTEANAAMREALPGVMPPFPPESALAYRAAILELMKTMAGGELYRSPKARELTLPGDLKLRVIESDEPRGVYLHVHGGGWVLGGADQQDAALERFVADTGYTVVSVEYRLAPEAPFPAALDDCEHAARWLAANALTELGSEHLAIGGDSAGATLALATLVRLRANPGAVPFAAGNLFFGVYDLTMTPSQHVGDSPILPLELLTWFYDQYVPDPTRRADPEVSPLYADLRGLPPLLLTVGTSDPLLDDTLFLHARLLAANVPVELQVLPGGDHGFDLMPLAITEQALAKVAEFLSVAARTRQAEATPTAGA